MTWKKKGDYDALTFVEKANEECALLNDLNEYFIELLKVGANDTVVWGASPSTCARLSAKSSPISAATSRPTGSVTLKLDLPETLIDIDVNALRLILMNLVELTRSTTHAGTRGCGWKRSAVSTVAAAVSSPC